jgi:ElaB/YqjD/DUF883 family membrane-anchored ribosome-binding protein
MNTAPTSAQTPRSGSSLSTKPSSAGFTASIGDAVDSGRDFQADAASVKDSFARAASHAGEAVRSVSQTVASQVGSAASSMTDASSELAAAAKEHAKTLASELEAMARRNPLGTLVGALVVGVVIGMMSRSRT